MRLFLFAGALAALCACTQPASKPAETPAPPVSAAPAFAVNLTFSPKAAAKLAELKEQVIVDAMYYGAPRPGFEPKEAGDIGVDLGSTQNTVQPVNGATEFAPAFDAAKLATEVVGEPRVLINVYSARLAHPDNLLSCGIYDDMVSAAAKAAPAITCALIEE